MMIGNHRFKYHTGLVVFLLLLSLIPILLNINDTNAIGGINADIILDETTTDQTVDISESGSQTVIVEGYITLTSKMPHVVQNIEITFDIHLYPSPYDMREHFEENHEVNPDPIVFSRVLPDTTYRENFTISIFFDKNFYALDYRFDIEGTWTSNPGTGGGTIGGNESFNINVIPFKEVDLEAPEVVEIDWILGGSYEITAHNNGNVESWYEYSFEGLENANDKGVIIEPRIGSNVEAIMNGETETWIIPIECENPAIGTEIIIGLTWYEDSSRTVESDFVGTRIIIIGQEEPVGDDDDEVPVDDDDDVVVNDDDIVTDDDDVLPEVSNDPKIGIFPFVIGGILIAGILVVIFIYFKVANPSSLWKNDIRKNEK